MKVTRHFKLLGRNKLSLGILFITLPLLSACSLYQSEGRKFCNQNCTRLVQEAQNGNGGGGGFEESKADPKECAPYFNIPTNEANSSVQKYQMFYNEDLKGITCQLTLKEGHSFRIHEIFCHRPLQGKSADFLKSIQSFIKQPEVLSYNPVRHTLCEGLPLAKGEDVPYRRVQEFLKNF